MARPREIDDERILAVARRCFIEKGAALSSTAIAKELGVSHATLFNRFGSKEALLIAALGPPPAAWAPLLERGPDDRPIRDQLVELCLVFSAYFDELSKGYAILQGAGIGIERVFKGDPDPSPVRALRGVTAWIKDAQRNGQLGRCDPGVLAATLLGALQSWAFTSRVSGAAVAKGGARRHVERFIDLLWRGIAPEPNQKDASHE